MVVKFIYSIAMFYEKKKQFLQFISRLKYLIKVNIFFEDKQSMYEKSITIYHTYESGLFDYQLSRYDAGYVNKCMGNTALDY